MAVGMWGVRRQLGQIPAALCDRPETLRHVLYKRQNMPDSCQQRSDVRGWREQQQ